MAKSKGGGGFVYASLPLEICQDLHDLENEKPGTVGAFVLAYMDYAQDHAHDSEAPADIPDAPDGFSLAARLVWRRVLTSYHAKLSGYIAKVEGGRKAPAGPGRPKGSKNAPKGEVIKAIETVYNGHRFRSRLEARWAVFFDALNVDYEYEPEGFDLGDGLYYLPDFRVKCYGTRGSVGDEPFDLWIEVKGHMTDVDAEKIRRFANVDSARQTLENPILVVGNIPERDYYNCGAGYDYMDGTDITPFNYELIDGDFFAAYPAAHESKFYLWGDACKYINLEDTVMVEQALDKARMARF